MKHHAKEYVVHIEDVEHIVQDVFMELWEKHPVLADLTRLTAYLFTAVKTDRSMSEPAYHGAKCIQSCANEYQAILHMNLNSLKY